MMHRYILLLFSLLLLACGNSTAQVEHQPVMASANSDAEFADAMIDKVFQNYLHLRSALVNADTESAVTAARAISEALTDEWRGAKTAAFVISLTRDITAQRAAFADLSEEIAPLIEHGLKTGTIYKMHCPMAFDGAGADWFSEVAEVRNPFYGDKMLTCGKVTDTISK
ncbi:hypothetical protein LEM8419_00501 [Neolewinella maritima]|uniref:DUF3347 domain-containing protein n=1 Tax=Neolewinella maritima TaxID=1383882 RepID=A0ABM9AWU3_9BACT|nr:DUF3347 domain-containing protein [Neolewinella maritima]CAH0999204.1 hypothetical protein LEM8419_00501 [Neolewinella maritima]